MSILVYMSSSRKRGSGFQSDCISLDSCFRRNDKVSLRYANPIRRHVSDELAHSWRSLKLTDPVAVVDKTRVRRITWLGTEHQEG